MHRELSVQLARLEEAVGRDAKDGRLDRRKADRTRTKALTEIKDAVRGVRDTIAKRLAAFGKKLTEIGDELRRLKRSGPVAGSGALAELEVRAVGPNQYRISRAQFAEQAYELSRLASQVQLSSNFKGGKVNGVRVVEADVFLLKFGILAGDVILRVNGVPLVDPRKTLQVFRSVQDAKEIEITLLRHGKEIKLRVTVGP